MDFLLWASIINLARQFFTPPSRVSQVSKQALFQQPRASFIIRAVESAKD
jgi:hypothetical protein